LGVVEMIVMTTDLALAILRVVAGLLIAGHGAMKVFGAFRGPGLRQWTSHVAGMGFRPAGVWARVGAWGELLGGIALAVGFLTPVAAAVCAVNMLVAIWKVHWTKGLWVTQGGYEYPLLLFVLSAVIGLRGVTAYSLDEMLGIARSAPLAFVAALLVGTVLAAIGGAPIGVGREERRAA
jgi:putative oxidoreductase